MSNWDGGLDVENLLYYIYSRETTHIYPFVIIINSKKATFLPAKSTTAVEILVAGHDESTDESIILHVSLKDGKPRYCTDEDFEQVPSVVLQITPLLITP